MTRWVKCRSARSLHAADRASSTFSPAVISSSSGIAQHAHRRRHDLGQRPRRVPSTGVPENSASIVGNPNGSSIAPHPEAAGTGEQHRFSLPTDFADVLDACKRWTPARPRMISRRPVRFAASTAH